MKGYVRSSPYFFRLVKIAFGITVAVLLAGALLIPAPLQGPADLARVPNPSKSAWFLLWMQELVSYSNALAYLLLALGVYFFFLPYWPGTREATRAQWFPRDQWPISAVTLVTFAVIILLTVVALFFRGENWAFVLPF